MIGFIEEHDIFIRAVDFVGANFIGAPRVVDQGIDEIGGVGSEKSTSKNMFETIRADFSGVQILEVLRVALVAGVIDAEGQELTIERGLKGTKREKR